MNVNEGVTRAIASRVTQWATTESLGKTVASLAAAFAAQEEPDPRLRNPCSLLLRVGGEAPPDLDWLLLLCKGSSAVAAVRVGRPSRECRGARCR